jgi:probable rRNA maturation factor
MKASVEINVASALWRGLPRARSLARDAIAACLAETGVAARVDRPGGQASFGVEVSVCLADDARLCALNTRWRGIEKPTNVLSFPSADSVGAVTDRAGSALTGYGAGRCLGDIALAYETVAREAEELAVPLADHYRHLVAHGFLHLIGYDHETDEEAERMEALEAGILARLGAANPYAREVQAPEVIDE